MHRASAVAAPPHIAHIDGAITIEREGLVEVATLNAPIVVGDRLRTAAGRVDVLFPDGTALDLDEYSIRDPGMILGILLHMVQTA